MLKRKDRLQKKPDGRFRDYKDIYPKEAAPGVHLRKKSPRIYCDTLCVFFGHVNCLYHCGPCIGALVGKVSYFDCHFNFDEPVLLSLTKKEVR